MQSVRHNDAAETDHVLLDAARESILAVGWRRTTLTEVARRAGVSRMTLYRRWPDMQALLGDLLTREWGAALQEAAADTRGSALERAVRCVVGVARAVRHDPLFEKIRDVDPELLLPYLLDRRGRSQELVLRGLEPLLEEAQRAGDVRRTDPGLLVRTLMLAAEGFVLSVPTMTDGGVTEADLDAELGALVERYLRS